jgi:hypothetical protein
VLLVLLLSFRDAGDTKHLTEMRAKRLNANFGQELVKLVPTAPASCFLLARQLQNLAVASGWLVRQSCTPHMLILTTSAAPKSAWYAKSNITNKKPGTGSPSPGWVLRVFGLGGREGVPNTRDHDASPPPPDLCASEQRAPSSEPESERREHLTASRQRMGPADLGRARIGPATG